MVLCCRSLTGAMADIFGNRHIHIYVYIYINTCYPLLPATTFSYLYREITPLSYKKQTFLGRRRGDKHFPTFPTSSFPTFLHLTFQLPNFPTFRLSTFQPSNFETFQLSIVPTFQPQTFQRFGPNFPTFQLSNFWGQTLGRRKVGKLGPKKVGKLKS